MSDTGEFRLFPTVRSGYRPDSNFSKDASDLADAGTADVSMEVKGEGEAGTTTKAVSVSLDIYGPGEVTNIDTDQIVRMEPEPDTTAFPPNYFPLVEFDDPKLPWLFSPQRADGAGRNIPWLCLVVVPTESSTLEPPGTGPLPALETTARELPDPTESWAWAHAQLIGTGAPEDAFDGRSMKTKARLLCPRNLSPKTKYRACVVPTFEPGRRAGLGLDPSPEGSAGIAFAWSGEGPVRLPVYHYWVFTSAAAGDFESLARELEPRTFESDIGFRTIDVSNPGPASLKPKRGAGGEAGTVGVGGALKAIGAEPDDYGETLTSELRELLNTPHDVIEATDYGAVGPPLYGQWHAGVPRLEPASVDGPFYYYPTWFNQLNTDPRHRIPAGYGTQVVQREQEALMASAWEQFGEVQEANRALRRMQLAKEVQRRRQGEVESLSTGTLLGLTSPMHGALLDEELGKTVRAQAVETDLPEGLSSPAFRRITRARGPLARRTGVSMDPSKFVTRLESGRVPRLTDGLSFTDDVVPSQAVGPAAAAASAGGTGQRHSPEDDERSDAFRPGGSPIPTDGDSRTGARPLSGRLHDDGADASSDPQIDRVVVILDSIDAHATAADRRVDTLSSAVRQEDTETVAELVDEDPTLEDRCASIGPDTFAPLSRRVFKLLAEPRPEALVPTFDRETATGHLQGLHSAQRRLDAAMAGALAGLRTEPQRPQTIQDALQRAKNALAEMQRRTSGLRSALEPAPARMRALSATTAEGEAGLSIETAALSKIGTAGPATITLPSKTGLRRTILDGIDPATAIHEHAADVLGVPDLRYRDDPVEEVLAAPTFEVFGYRLLSDLNQEYFLPGVGEIPNNSMGLLQTNPEFIEAFMAGLNHEMARELQWRRYPTDRKGTYFRRFWNRKGNPDVDPTDPEEMADIEPVHTWDQRALGENSPRDDAAKVVLLIRGELLRRYPNTDIFAAKAVGDGGQGDDADRVPALPGTHVTRDDAAGTEDLTFPVFRGTLDPDITFFGFDLTPDEALYEPYHTDETADPDDHPDEGWFFVLQEPPAETRFGMDVGTDDDVGETPPGISHDGGGPAQIDPDESDPDAVEHGWSALSWAHLVSDGTSPSEVTYVDVDGSRPGAESWAVEADTSYVAGSDGDPYDRGDAATWGYNSAHMARATWQLPVRISVHADDMITEETEETWRVATMPAATVTTVGGEDA